MKEVYSGIFLINEKGSFGHIKPSANIYIFAGEDGLIFDAGFGNRSAIKYFKEEFNKIKALYENQGLKLNVTRIIPSHSHPDHFSGLKKLREELGVKIVLTKKTASIIADKKSFMKSFKADSYSDYLLIKKSLRSRIRDFIQRIFTLFLYKRIYGLAYIADPDEIIDDNSEISINGETWKIFPSTGHAIDHISLYNEDKGVLLGGDNVLKSITTWLGPPNSNIEAYMNTIKYLYKLPNLTLILPAHGDLITSPKERIKQVLDHRESRSEQVFEIVRNNLNRGVSPDEIIDKLYTHENGMLKEIARGWVCLTLKMLEDQQLIKREESDKVIKFFPINKL
jgi:glyoxylase-like metal-dependent hydrolase (beta-lactamase superfamily II)